MIFLFSKAIHSRRYEYRGNAVWRNGKVERVLFPGGYATLTNGSESGAPTFHYYTTDYLGNVRAVTNGTTGETEQTVAYYPFGSLIATLGTNRSLQPYKFGGKELLTGNGLNEYDFGARSYVPSVPAFTTTDPLCEKYYWLSPYLYCANNPVNCIDDDGKETRLYTTRLPENPMPSFLGLECLSRATHSFITVTRGGYTHYFAYGSTKGGIIGAFSGSLKRMKYPQDIDIIKGKEETSELLKECFTIDPPDGMTQEEFDNNVIEVANSFGNNEDITYMLDPEDELTGNCNSSTYTILLKAGVSEKDLEIIGEKIQGIKWGFGKEKPWTKEEQSDAVNSYVDQILKNLTMLTKH